MNRCGTAFVLVIFGLAFLVPRLPPLRAEPVMRPTIDYRFTGEVPLGAPGWWDYLTYDPSSKRLYASHADRISVFDVAHQVLLGSIGPMEDAHGVAIVPRLGKGYATSGGDGTLKVFSLADFHLLKQIKVGFDCDGVVYDKHSQSILVVSGDGRSLTILDPRHDSVTQTVALPGKPEFLAVDDGGEVYINLADTDAIAKVDIESGKVMATWPLLHCNDPHGLAYDRRSGRLFSGCANGRLIVVNTSDGSNIADLPIGTFSDAIVADANRRLVFSANGDGTLTVIGEDGDSHYRVLRTIPTFFGGRNMTVDPTTGTIFIAHGNMKLESPINQPLVLRFGWDGLDVAMFEPAS